MYERFYQLRERPFALSPDPDYLYPSRVHQEALDYLRYGIESLAGFVVITGEIGSGKTTLLQTVLQGLDSQTTVARVVNTMLEPRELLETMMIDLGLDPSGRSKPLMLRDLAQFLVDQRMSGRLVLLVIDEAQNLSLPALEEVRMLSNLETEKSKLLQIVLIGQPDLRDTLASAELVQLRQRITVSYHLNPLDADDTAAYVNHRLRRASTTAPLQFPREVTDVIHERSGGVPRLINVVCDAVLVFGYAEERRVVDRALLDEALKELETTGVLVSSAPGSSRVEASRSIASTPPPEILVAQAAQAAIAGREQDLGRRERALADRERELTEQRRVLAEEYRLLRRASTSTPPSGDPLRQPALSRAEGPALRRAEGPVLRQVEGPGLRGATIRVKTPAARRAEMPRDTVWARLWRALLGLPEPVVSDQVSR